MSFKTKVFQQYRVAELLGVRLGDNFRLSYDIGCWDDESEDERFSHHFYVGLESPYEDDETNTAFSHFYVDDRDGDLAELIAIELRSRAQRLLDAAERLSPIVK